jgi:hypothetical protein
VNIEAAERFLGRLSDEKHCARKLKKLKDDSRQTHPEESSPKTHTYTYVIVRKIKI